MYVCPTCGLGAEGGGFCTEDGSPLARAEDPLLGRVIGSYRIARVAGRGGMGVVYLGVHPTIGSRVAIKLLSVSHADSPSLVERFFSEARAVNVIRHEGIVNVLDLAVLSDGRPYIVMEYLEGGPLSRHIAEQGALPLGTFTTLALEVLDALAAAHLHGIVHRDLKPDNVFVTLRGRAKVLDFGIAKLKPELGAGDVATRTGSLLGTPQYMSPEQARGLQADARSDVYSFGVMLYEGVTGRRPFEADSLFELLRQHIEARPTPPRALRPDLPAAYDQIILRTLEKDPALRHQSAAELADALSEAARFLPPASHTPLMAQPSSLRSLPPVRQAMTPPTAPGTSATLALVPSPASKSRLPLILGLVAAGSVLLAFVGLVVGAFGVGLAAGGRDSTPPKTTAPLAPTTGGSMRTAIKGVAQDGARFDLVRGLPDAQEAAREFQPDAELSSMTASRVKLDGTMDMKLSARSASYMFRSKSRLSPPCLVSVAVTGGQKYVTELQSGPCSIPTVDAPHCTMSQVMKKAYPDGQHTVRRAPGFVRLPRYKRQHVDRWRGIVGPANPRRLLILRGNWPRGVAGTKRSWSSPARADFACSSTARFSPGNHITTCWPAPGRWVRPRRSPSTLSWS